MEFCDGRANFSFSKICGRIVELGTYCLGVYGRDSNFVSVPPYSGRYEGYGTRPDGGFRLVGLLGVMETFGEVLNPRIDNLDSSFIEKLGRCGLQGEKKSPSLQVLGVES